MRKVDYITSLMLFLIVFLGILLIYLIKIDRNMKDHDLYYNTIVNMKLLDKSFDNFLLKRSTFINYDTINLQLKTFEKNIHFLDLPSSHQLFSSEYGVLLETINIAFKEKQNFIEHFKSNSASLLNSIHYIFDLKKAIEKYGSKDQTTLKVVNDQTLLLMKYYINSYIDKKKMQTNLNFLNQAIAKQNNHIELELFVMHMTRNIKRIENYNKIKNRVYNETTLSDTIDHLNIFVNNYHQENIFIQKIITTIFFTIALSILIVLLIMHKRALLIKSELLGFKTAVENSDNSVVITDPDKNITYVNDAFQKETGYTQQEVFGQNPRVLKSGAMDQSIYDNLNRTLDNGKRWEGEFVNMRKDKSLYYEKASISPIYINNELKHYLAIKLNITDYIKQKEELEFLALYDSLTGLPNRTNIEKYIKKKISQGKDSHSPITLLFIDLDRFKIINDTLGHDVGDELLLYTSKRLKHSLKDSDLLSRFGGDEFLIVLENSNTKEYAREVCEKIIQTFTKPIATQRHQLNITLSIGVSIFPDDGEDYQSLLKHAEVAMYQAKDAGKNTFRYYQKQLSVDVKNRLNIEQAFNSAFAKNEFYMMYQPQYTLIDKKVVGLEALVRWKSPTLGFVTPDQFIPIAEDTGFILELGRFVFTQACQDFLTFQQHFDALKTISINISAVQIYQETFLEDIVSIIQEIGISPQSIVLEITETYIMKDVNHSMRILNAFKAVGFNISIDDFGTGYSSLGYLKKFPINELKIDKSFVDGIPNDPSDMALTQVIIGLSKNLVYLNVAEGIENEQQEQFLIENACTLGQGYYFCRPKIKEELLKFKA